MSARSRSRVFSAAAILFIMGCSLRASGANRKPVLLLHSGRVHPKPFSSKSTPSPYAHAPRCLNTGAISSWRAIMNKLSVLGIIVGAALLSAAPCSLQWSQKNVALSLDSADARVGRPLTATSVAGVHRRAYRRAYRHGHYYYRRVAARSLVTSATRVNGAGDKPRPVARHQADRGAYAIRALPDLCLG